MKNTLPVVWMLGLMLFGLVSDGVPADDVKRTGRAWLDMDYGGYLMSTVESPQPKGNFAYKGISIRLAGDTRTATTDGNAATVVFDKDLLRYSAGWTGGLLQMRSIVWDGSHQTHPKLDGDLVFVTRKTPGWSKPGGVTGFHDPRELPYGPLPREWAKWKGLYVHGKQVVLSYSVGKSQVLESPGLRDQAGQRIFTRTINVDRIGKGGSSISVAESLGETTHILSRKTMDKVEDGVADTSFVVIGKLKSPPKTKVETKPAKPTTKGLVARWSFDDIKVGSVKNVGGKGYAARIHGGKVTKGIKGNGIKLGYSGRIDVEGGEKLELGNKSFTITAWIKKRGRGTIFSKAKAAGEWARQGKTMYVEGGKLHYDVGWVGLVSSKGRLAPGKWQHVGMSYDAKSKTCRLYINGRVEAEKRLTRIKADNAGDIFRLGAGPYKGGFNGALDEVRVYDRVLTKAEMAAFGDGKSAATTTDAITAIGVVGANGAKWVTKDGAIRLQLKANDLAAKFIIITWRGDRKHLKVFTQAFDKVKPVDLKPLTKGGPARWSKKVVTEGKMGSVRSAYTVDVITTPAKNPWRARVRIGGFDFFKDGKRAAIACWDGDVWVVSGLGNKLGKLTWQRIASGMFQPLGLKIVDEKIYVLCRDEITILHDLNGDGEADFYENFNDDATVTEHFHEFAMALQQDKDGHFYYAKGGRHALDAVVPQHGTIIKVWKDGSKSQIIAKGFRAPNGLHVNDDGTFITSDQQGHWTPANRINWVKPGGFYGYVWSYFPNKKPTTYDKPLVWLHPNFDRSPAEQLFVDSKKWGPLGGKLLSMSYGTGYLYHVMHEKVNGERQGAAVRMPIKMFPTGVSRGRFHPGDGQLYVAGLFGWAGNRTTPGGFYRVRYTGKPLHLPMSFSASKNGILIQFSGKLDAELAADIDSFDVEMWNYQWKQRYGSGDYRVTDGKRGRDKLKVKRAQLGRDGKSVFLTIEGMKPCMTMRVRYDLESVDGEEIRDEIHATIHALGKDTSLDE